MFFYNHIFHFVTSRTSKIAALLIGYFLSFPSSTYATDIINGSLKSQIVSKTGLGSTDPIAVSANIISYFLTALGVIAIILIIYGGFQYMFSRGNEEEVKKALGILKAAFIGLLIILASYGIALYVFEVIEGSTGQQAIP